MSAAAALVASLDPSVYVAATITLSQVLVLLFVGKGLFDDVDKTHGMCVLRLARVTRSFGRGPCSSLLYTPVSNENTG